MALLHLHANQAVGLIPKAPPHTLSGLILLSHLPPEGRNTRVHLNTRSIKFHKQACAVFSQCLVLLLSSGVVLLKHGGNLECLALSRTTPIARLLESFGCPSRLGSTFACNLHVCVNGNCCIADGGEQFLTCCLVDSCCS